MSASLGVTLVGCVMCVGIAQAQSSTSSASPPLTSPGVSVSTPARTSLQIGTAFVVADGYVLTALHVVEGKEMILLGPMDRTRWMRAELVKSDAKLDLALLKARLVLPALSFVRWSEVPVGLEVSVIGFPQPRVQGLSKKITQGIINGNRSDRNESIDTGYFQLSAEVAMGNSGGPVLAPDGSVVGMVQKKVNVQGVAERTNDVLVNVSFALKSAQLLEFLKDTPAQPVVRPLAIETVLRPYQLFAQTEPSVLAVVARQPSSRSSSESPP
jgi:serine protease Do